MIGTKIKELRKKEKMTQLDLAKLLELSPSAVGMYEQNRRKPNLKILLTLSKIFDVSVDYLLGAEHKKEQE